MTGDLRNAIVNGVTVEKVRYYLTAYVELRTHYHIRRYGGCVLADTRRCGVTSGKSGGAGHLMRLIAFFGVDRLDEIEERSVRIHVDDSEPEPAPILALVHYLHDERRFEWPAYRIDEQ